MPVKGKAKLSSMFYVLLVQDGRVMPDCFPNAAGFKIHDGPLKIHKLRSDGIVTELMEGTVISGKFHDDEE
jgi:hypothetical protein